MPITNLISVKNPNDKSIVNSCNDDRKKMMSEMRPFFKKWVKNGDGTQCEPGEILLSKMEQDALPDSLDINLVNSAISDKKIPLYALNGLGLLLPMMVNLPEALCEQHRILGRLIVYPIVMAMGYLMIRANYEFSTENKKAIELVNRYNFFSKKPLSTSTIVDDAQDSLKNKLR